MEKNLIGEIGELSVITELLKKSVESYKANSKTQKDWDIVVISKNNEVKRIQVKTTILQNKTTNNSINIKKANFDFLIIVVIDENSSFIYYILSKSEALAIQGGNVKLGISEFVNGKYKVIDSLTKHKDKWDVIK